MSPRLFTAGAALLAGAAWLRAGASTAEFSVVAARDWDLLAPAERFATGVSLAASQARLSGSLALDPAAGGATAALTLTLRNPNVGLPLGYLDGFSLNLPAGVALVPGSVAQEVTAGDWINFTADDSAVAAPLTLAAGGLAFVPAYEPERTSPTLAPGHTARFTLALTGVGADWTLATLFPPGDDPGSFDFVFRFAQLFGNTPGPVFDRVGLQLRDFAVVPEPAASAAFLALAAAGAAVLRRRSRRAERGASWHGSPDR